MPGAWVTALCRFYQNASALRRRGRSDGREGESRGISTELQRALNFVTRESCWVTQHESTGPFNLPHLLQVSTVKGQPPDPQPWPVPL